MTMKRWNKCRNRALTRLLTWLGIGSSALLFAACYGPRPTGYNAEPYDIGADTLEQVVADEEAVAEEVDSVAVASEHR